MTLETKAGLKKLDLKVENGLVGAVCVDMGEPILEPALIPVNVSGDYAIHVPLTIDQVEYEINCVSMGNPHAVIFTGGIDALNLPELGPKFELNEIFPKRTNTEFVEILDEEHVKMRVWERGAGETLACGTGALCSVGCWCFVWSFEKKSRG